MRALRFAVFFIIAALSAVVRGLVDWAQGAIDAAPAGLDAEFLAALASIIVTTALFSLVARTPRSTLADAGWTFAGQAACVLLAMAPLLLGLSFTAFAAIANTPVLAGGFLVWRFLLWLGSAGAAGRAARLAGAAIAVLAAYLVFDRPLAQLYNAMVIIPGAAPPANAVRIALIPDEERQGRRVGVLTHHYEFCDPRTDELYRAPRGFETDFASIPQGARIAIDPFGRHAEAAVIHDWLYAVGETGRRADADDIFRYMMKRARVNLLKRNAMHAAVRAGGEVSFGRADEWRFRDPDSLVVAETPPPRATVFAADKVDCAD